VPNHSGFRAPYGARSGCCCEPRILWDFSGVFIFKVLIVRTRVIMWELDREAAANPRVRTYVARLLSRVHSSVQAEFGDHCRGYRIC
jgi:hypothetical protein